MNKKDFTNKYENRYLKPYDVTIYKNRLYINSFIGTYYGSLGNSMADSRYLECAGDSDRSYLNPANSSYITGSVGKNDIFLYDIDKNICSCHKNAHYNRMMDFDHFGDKYYIVTESGKIITLDEKTCEMATHHGPTVNLYAIKINQKTGDMFLSSWTDGTFEKYDTRKLKMTGKRQLWTFLFGITLNESANTVMVAEPMNSRIIELDGKTLKTIRYLDAGLGVRDIQYAPDTGKIYSANYFDGTYTETDYKTGKVTRRVFIGRAPRGVFRDSTTGRIFASSDCGIFEIRQKP